MSTMTIVGIILAAGRGRRLGLGPKAFAELDGEAFLVHGERLLREGGVSQVIAVLPPGGRGMVRDPGASTVYEENHDREAGPLWSIQLGLGLAGEADALVLHHVDHPRVRPETVISLLVAVESAPYGVARVIPTYRGRRGHPVVVLTPGIAALRAVVDPRETTLRDVLSAAGPVHELEVDDPGILRNVNTPEELARCT